VFPEARRVEVYDGEADVVTLGEEDTLTGGALLPGFALPVRNIFE
jgi:hypothetical protein